VRAPFRRGCGRALCVSRPGGAARAQGVEESQILTALAHLLGSPRLAERVAPGQKVAVVMSDVTRPCPSARLLPAEPCEPGWLALRAGLFPCAPHEECVT
jgi:nickel-dependent lactate racemase